MTFDHIERLCGDIGYTWRFWYQKLIGSFFEELDSGRPPKYPRVSVIVAPRPVVVVNPPKESLTVGPPPRSVWDDQGWTVHQAQSGRVFDGDYCVKTNTLSEPRRFRGRIVEPAWPGTITAYIADPPAELRQHPKGACFQLTKLPWFRIHWTRAPRNPDDAVLYVERILAEALQHGN